MLNPLDISDEPSLLLSKRMRPLSRMVACVPRPPATNVSKSITSHIYCLCVFCLTIKNVGGDG